MGQLTTNLWPERHDNPSWPLPRDYPSLTPEGQRLARIALVTQQSTPADLTLAWLFFCSWYLWPDDAHFYKRKLPPAPGHMLMIHDLGQYAFNLFAAPRSFAKSTVMSKSVPIFFAYTRPAFHITLVGPKQSKVAELFDEIKMQIEDNPYLANDFGPLKPNRSNGIWSNSVIRLPNKFRIDGMPITGKNRGLRPDLLILDDVEYDPETPEAGPQLTEALERKMFQMYMPMTDSGTSMFVVGTVTRMNSYMYRALHSRDPRFEFWNRRLLQVRTDTGLVWKEKWSAERIDQLEAQMGSDAFATEFLNRPLSKTARSFAFSPELHTYDISSPDSQWETNPLASAATVTFRVKHPDTDTVEARYAPAAEYFANCFRFITADFSRKVTHTSDFSSVLVMAADHDGTLWCLDLWLNRQPRDVVIRTILSLAAKWRVRLIAPESVSFQQEIGDIITRQLDRQFRDAFGYVPAVFPLKWNDRSKGDRISTLEWRFRHNRIRLPAGLLNRWPFSELLAQIVSFTGDPDQLRYDDAIDTLAMSTDVLRNRRVPSLEKRLDKALVPALIESTADPHSLHHQLNVNVLSGMNASNLTEADLHALRTYAERNVPRRLGRTLYAEDGDPDVTVGLQNAASTARSLAGVVLPAGHWGR